MPLTHTITLGPLHLRWHLLQRVRLIYTGGGTLEGELVGAVCKGLVHVGGVIIVGVKGRGGSLAIPEVGASWVQVAKAPAAASAFCRHLKGEKGVLVALGG